MYMKRILLIVCLLIVSISVITGCGNHNRPDDSESMDIPVEDQNRILESETDTPMADSTDEAPDVKEDKMQIKVTDGTNEIVFQLGGGSAAKSLYEQLPLTLDVENYGSNEKIFYPPEKLDTSDVMEGDCPSGTLAYFSPWDNVVMYYGPFGAYPGLYILGEAVEGAENIKNLSGTITITAE